MKYCNECKKERLPEGGVDLGRGRWMCASCWAHKAARRKP